MDEIPRSFNHETVDEMRRGCCHIVVVMTFGAIGVGCSSSNLDRRLVEHDGALEASLTFVDSDASCMLSLQIQNVSNHFLSIPKDYYVTSNLVPNGNERSIEGVMIHVGIGIANGPVDQGHITDYFSVKYVDDQIYEGLGELIRLRPGEGYSYAVDLSNQLYPKSDAVVDVTLSVQAGFRLTRYHMGEAGSNDVVNVKSNEMVVDYPCR